MHLKNTKTLTVHKPTLTHSRLSCRYTAIGEQFENSYDFPEPITDELLNDPVTIKLCELTAITTSFGLFSVDYFDQITCDYYLNEDEVVFFEKLMFYGLGEFRYVNSIPLNTKTRVTGSVSQEIPIRNDRTQTLSSGALLLNGGGKDGSVSAWLLSASNIPFTWFQRGNSAAQASVLKQWSAPAVIIKRNLDQNRSNRKYAGHRPMSAGIALIALLSAHVYGFRDVIASNETSANEGNSVIDGFPLNHQYSKSLEFESDLQQLLDRASIGLRYFSLLRPLHELQIGVLASNLSDDQLAAIVSCNQGTREGYWCLKCAKCAFVILILTAASPITAKRVWGRKDIINTPSLYPYIAELISPDVDKPLECVGTLEECQLAAGMVINQKETNELLSKEVRELLNRYAASDRRDVVHFLNKLSQSAVPDEYRHVLALMQSELTAFSSQNH